MNCAQCQQYDFRNVCCNCENRAYAYTQLDKVIKELLPGVAHIVLEDYGRLNDVCMEITRRRKLANEE